ncbi:hypothetical protein DB346_09080 [Verrucomicrobia bacterium LW23]|nr:hypothetical protein DB346_09080 [Verrucomicrobia bacterium LW23]
MNRPLSTRAASAAAFSLLELLFTVSIIAVIMALSVPMIQGVSEANNISAAGQIVSDYVSQARQLAAARNVSVEVRFVRQQYGLQGPLSSYPNVYNAVQLWRVDPAGSESEPVSKMTPLPQGIVVAVGTSAPYLSPPLVGTATPPPLSGTLAYGPQSLNYVGFEIRPSGLIPNMLDMGMANTFISVLPVRYMDKNANDLRGTNRTVKNYALIQLNPFTGTAKVYQP